MIGSVESKEYKAVSYLIGNNNMQIIALHNDMAEEMNNMFGICNTLVVNNGIDISRFEKASPSVRDFRNSLGIPADAFVIGHVGRFAPQKNHELIINIFNAVAEKNSKAFLLLIGTGQMENQIKAWLKEKKLLHRALILTHRTDIPDLMKIMDVFVFPSFYEGLSVVLVEAQVARLKCVISDAISQYAILSNIVTVVKLTDSLEKWRDAILERPERLFKADFNSWDINKVVKQLEKNYE